MEAVSRAHDHRLRQAGSLDKLRKCCPRFAGSGIALPLLGLIRPAVEIKMKGATCGDIGAVLFRHLTTVLKGTGGKVGIFMQCAHPQSLMGQLFDGPDKLAAHLFWFFEPCQAIRARGRQHTAKEFGCITLCHCWGFGWLRDSGRLHVRWLVKGPKR